MGQQTSISQIHTEPTISFHKPSAGKQQCKTSFHYIPPLNHDFDLHQGLEEQEKQENHSLGNAPPPQIDLKTHQAQYWEIQNNHEEILPQSMKDIQNIEEIKVKWNQFIKMKKINYLQDYTILKEIGRGGFGCVHKVKARYTGLYRAAKRIKKSQLNKSQLQKLFQEMVILMSLDHPNIAKLYQVYDYKSYYVLILELCEGGELFKKLVTKQLNEQISGKIMKQILGTLIYLHKKNIVHRDLKPQNMLFQSDSDTLKIIDFGIAVKKKPNQPLTQRLGTPYYIAPQVLCKNYGEKCDIWSAGIILYMMISGIPPFRGDNEYQVMENILKSNLQFKGNIWNQVTSDCKNLISWMLTKNPNERPSAQQAYGHPWIKKFCEKKSRLRNQTAIKNIRGFSFQNKLQAVVYTYVVSQLLTSEEKKFLFETFKELDQNNDGVIESTELRSALKTRKDISQDRVNFLMRIIDTNGSGHIDYTQFLVAALDPSKALTEIHFEQAFQYFDIDHSGVITFEEIAHFLEDTKQSVESIKKIFKQVDQNSDGNISKEEFVKLLMKETKKKIRSLRSIKDLGLTSEKISIHLSDNDSVKQKMSFSQYQENHAKTPELGKQPQLKQNIPPEPPKQKLRDSKLMMSPMIKQKNISEVASKTDSPKKVMKSGLKKGQTDKGSPKKVKKVVIVK